MEVFLTEKKIIAMHQPNYIPWAGYFYKIFVADIFVFLDDAQYTKNSFINRNRIKGPNGPQWLTVPVKVKMGQYINQVNFADSLWPTKHFKTFDACYKRSPYYGKYRDKLREIIETPYSNISDINVRLILQIAEWLNLSCKFYFSSDLSIDERSGKRLVQIVKKVGGNVYLSGWGGARYQDEQIFTDSNIVLQYYNFTPPVYTQLWEDFVPGLTVLDLLFNCGNGSLDKMRN